ncbi:GGDEF domain-containing protein [Leucothrix sargassi]|nr:GGDEF domain-containing protein [Leucothrix sargassi]
MTKPMSDAYFAEEQPKIHKRLIEALFYLVIAAIIATATTLVVALNSQFTEGTLSGVILSDWLNFVSMSLCTAGFVYARHLLSHEQVRKSVNVFIGSLTACMIFQAYNNGGLGEAPIVLFPLITVLSGYLGNIGLMKSNTIAIGISFVVLYIFGLVGITPPDMSPADPIETFFRLDQLIYVVMVVWLSYQTTKMFVNDYGSILGQLEKDQEKLDHIATHDKLTGLPNRYACEQHFERIFLDEPRHEGMCYLLMFLDIDNFKDINTRFGHNGGDVALTTVADRLSAAFEAEQATVSRIGGDEFIIMLSMPTDEMVKKLDQTMEWLAKPLTIFGETEYVTCSMGVVDVEQNTQSTFKDEYLKADLAMNRAKLTGKNRYRFFDQSITETAYKNIEIGKGLNEAIKNNEFTLFYQAQVDLSTRKITGAEGLIRWHKDGRLIPPDDFIPIAEKNGSIIPITVWVIQQACMDCAIWHSKGFEDLMVSVNIPSVMLAKGGLPDIVRRACEEASIEPKFLELELTESALLENGVSIRRQLADLRKMGVSLAIDDFGTGYSNLGYLSQLNVQKLKVDRCFVTDLLDSFHNQAIIQAIVNISDGFGMKTVVEGIEEELVVEPLLQLGCDIGQGYRWSKPVESKAFLDLLSGDPLRGTLQLISS